MKSPYVGLPVEKWEKKTRQLIEEHPLDPGEVFEVAIKVWNDIIETDCPICAWPNTTSCTVLHDIARIMCKLIIVSAVLRSNVSKISEIQTDSVLNRALHFIWVCFIYFRGNQNQCGAIERRRLSRPLGRIETTARPM